MRENKRLGATLKAIVLGTAIGAAGGGLVAVMGSNVAGHYSAQQKIQQRLGVAVQAYGVTDLDASGDFLVDHGMKFVYGGAALGAVAGAINERRRRYYW